jgi:lysophospholipase L1-like esterase
MRAASHLAAGLGALIVVTAGCGSPSKPAPIDQFPNGPKITCPDAPAALTSPTGQPLPVQYGTPIVTGGAPTVTVVCAPPSGSSFPVGTTAVTCTATDARQRLDSCSFNIVVSQPPRISVTRFVAFGDSITWGEDGRATAITSEGAGSTIRPAVQFPSSQTYPGALQAQLQGRYTTQTITVANSGKPGESVGDSATLSRFSLVVANRIYETVLLMEGSNDLSDRDSRKIPPALANLRTMVRDAKSRGLKVFLATIPPMVPGSQRGLAWSLVPEMNAGIRNIASSEGVPLVDVEAGFGSSFGQYIGSDGLHPNEAGYAKIADLFFGAIKSSLEVQPALTAPAGFPIVQGWRR